MSGPYQIGVLPEGGGEMGERIRAFDWAGHPLGPPGQWPSALHMAPVGERAAKLINVDWDVINDKRDEWTKRWNREVER